MKNFLLLLLFTLTLFSGCKMQEKTIGSGIIVSQTRIVGDFSGISTSSGIDVVFVDKSTDEIVVEGDNNLIDSIETEIINGNTLRIKTKDGFSYSTRHGIKVTVHNSGKINAINASGGSDVKTENCTLMDKNFSANFSGGSDFNGNVNFDNCELNCSGGSDFNISGTANTCTINCSGGSDFDGEKFIIKYCTINCSGGSDAEVNCIQTLTANAIGGSDIVYHGNCKVVKSSSGGSSINRNEQK